MKTKFAILALATLAMFAQNDPQQPVDDNGPGRGVARLSLINGDVSVRRGDAGEVVAGAMNSPVMVGDAVITGQQSRAEIQFDAFNMIRLGAAADVRLSELEFHRYMLQIASGTITFRVVRNNDASIELSTPSVALRPAHRGIYRVSIHPDGSSEITVRQGDIDIYTQKGSEHLNAGQAMLVRGDTDPEYQIFNAAPEDEWDRWNAGRDQTMDRAAANQHLNPDIYGAEDLEGSGRWVNNPAYGEVWAPAVTPDWAPYRNGRWVWEDYYGWTWVSYDSWGWAPYHYGRWFQDPSLGWCWWPGARIGHSYWRPALVGFFGFGVGGGVGVGVGFGFGHVGWVPLAPYEPYHPWWGRGVYGGYRNNTLITNNINISNVYRNARVDNAVTGMNAAQFGRAGVNGGSYTRVSRGDMQSAGLVRGQLPVSPDRASLNATDRTPRAGLSGSSNNRFFQTRQPAAVNRVPFEQQRAPQSQQAWRPSAPAVQQQAHVNAPPTNTATSNGGGGWRRFDQTSRPSISTGAERQPMRMNPSIVQQRPVQQSYQAPSRPAVYSQPQMGYRQPSSPPPSSSRPSNSQPSGGSGRPSSSGGHASSSGSSHSSSSRGR